MTAKRNSALLALVLTFFASPGCRRGDPAKEKDAGNGSVPARVSRTASGEPMLRLEQATQLRIGLRTEALVNQKISPELVAYGYLEEDPSRSFVLRAPIAGELHFTKGRNWPGLGERLADGHVISTIEPRLAPTERVSLSSQLATARSELAAATAAAGAARAAYERLSILNADNKNVSDRVLQDAQVRLRTEEARVQAAEANAHMLEASLNGSGPSRAQPLIVERGGDVIEVNAQPGESVEPGAPILRLTRLDQLLARVNVPVGQTLTAAVRTARIIAVGYENQPAIPAERIAVAIPPPPAATQGQAPPPQGESFLFRLRGTRFGLRPGIAITAYLQLPGSTQSGVIIPRQAIVRVAGAEFAYVQIGADEFVRRLVSTGRPAKEGIFVNDHFTSGDRVVVVGAQTLLSEELKSQISSEEEGR